MTVLLSKYLAQVTAGGMSWLEQQILGHQVVPLPMNAKSSSTWKQKGGRLLFGDSSVSRLWETVFDLIFQLCPLVFPLAVGEPINKEAWEWYFRVVGETRCPVVDTWWQTGEMCTTPRSSFCSPRLLE